MTILLVTIGMMAGSFKLEERSAYPVHTCVSQSFACKIFGRVHERALCRILSKKRTNAHRRLHTRQLGLIHICGRGKRSFSVKEAVAADRLVERYTKFVGDMFERQSNCGMVDAP